MWRVARDTLVVKFFELFVTYDIFLYLDRYGIPLPILSSSVLAMLLGFLISGLLVRHELFPHFCKVAVGVCLIEIANSFFTDVNVDYLRGYALVVAVTTALGFVLSIFVIKIMQKFPTER
nr:hypothetical protein [uncultured Halomonas sp.]